MVPLLVIDDLDDFVALLLDSLKDYVPLSDTSIDDLRRLACLLDSLSLRLFRVLSKVEFEPDGESDGGVNTRSKTNSSIPCFFNPGIIPGKRYHGNNISRNH